jgi:DNA modification methylase
MADGSVDAVVTDPPYGLEFMGKEWDRLGDRRQAKDLVYADSPYRRTKNNSGVSYGGTASYGAKAAEVGREMQAWHETWAVEAFRVLRPGGHLVAFSGTRTSHRMVCAIEDAGFEIRDSLCWLYGSGFPKSLDVGKAIDKKRDDDVRPVCRFLAAHMGSHRITDIVKALGFAGNGDHGVSAWFREDHVGPRVPSWDQWLALKDLLGFGDEMDAEVWRLNGRKGKPGEAWYEREVVKQGKPKGKSKGVYGDFAEDEYNYTAPATDLARQWDGWGTALKPAWEPIVLARKPLSGTVSANVAAHGTGALNVAGCRIGADAVTLKNYASRSGDSVTAYGASHTGETYSARQSLGRWPANLLLSHSPGCREVCEPDCPVALLDEQAGERNGDGKGYRTRFRPSSTDLGIVNDDGWQPKAVEQINYGDTGGVSRFFLNLPPDAEAVRFRYVAKASRRERNAGLEGMPERPAGVLQARAQEAGEYLDFVHPAPVGVGQWLKEHRERSGLSLKDVARHFPSKTGGLTGCVTNWEREYNRPTPDQWLTLKRVLGFDDRYDEVMTETVPVARTLFDDKPRVRATNGHPTVKPVALMRWLARLVTPPGGLILDPFAGSGSTLMAAVLEGFDAVGIEQDAEYVAIAERRVAHVERWGERWLEVAGKAAPADQGVINPKGIDWLATCPTHCEPIDRSGGPRRYRCGCDRVPVRYAERRAAKPTPALTDLPLFAALAPDVDR